ncbi:MAG: RHS repeat-associated core domain-containing protein, partial [Acidobacteriota bacterium]
VQSKKTANSGFFNYAKHFTYAASGAVTSMRLGNGLWESTQFNSRLQPVQIGLGTSVASQNLLKLNYDYGTNDNNGNVLSQTITVPAVGQTPGFTAVQSYSYDSLNRLKSAVENVTPHGGTAVQSWKQTFTFDRYGNHRFETANGSTTTLDPNCPEAICNPTISTANNRLSSTGWLYDAAGNTTADPEGRTFIYDGENKQKEVRDQYNTVIGQYYFDGDGQRVKKVVPSTGETTIFVYDAASKLIAEYSTIVAASQDAKVAYLTNDHLGSPRINTDANGNVTARHDYLPFGEEINAGTGGRTAAQGYGGQDNIRQKFTSYERDAETDLDFAQARMYNKNHGRFTSVDPFNVIFEKEKAKTTYEAQVKLDSYLSNPQKWNRYSYVLKNPLKFTDPTGLSEQGGTVIKHPDKRLVIIKTDEILTVNIQTKPANPVTGTDFQGDEVFRFDTEVTVTNENGEIEPSQSTLYYFNPRGQRSQNVDLATGESKPIVEEVNTDNEGVSEPEPRSTTVEVKGVKKDIDYKIQSVGNTVQVVQGSYDNRIIIPDVPKFINVSVSGNKPDPIVESMRPKRPGTTLVLKGY